MNETFAVIGFTLKNRLKSKSFLITSLIIALIISLVIHLPLIISVFSSDEPMRVGMVSDENEYAQQMKVYFEKDPELGIDIVLLADQGDSSANLDYAKKEIASGTLKGYLQTKNSSEEGFPQFNYLSQDTMDFGTRSTLQSALQVIKTEELVQSLGLTAEQVATLTTPVQIDNVQIAPSKPGDVTSETGGGRSETEVMIAYGLVYVLMILLFMGVVMYGNLIATEVTAEKSSRVMELLISSVSPIKQMFGKIVGMCLLGIIQLGAFLIVILINLGLPHNQAWLSDFSISLADIPFHLLIFFVVFYLLGFFLYGTVFASLGSLVSRTEDLGQAMMPITFITLAGFYIGIFGLNAPNATIVVASSFFPFFTPLIMFLRIGMASPAYWEIALSLLLLVGAIWFMGWFAAKIYRTGVLMYGKRPTFKELRKAMKAHKLS